MELPVETLTWINMTIIVGKNPASTGWAGEIWDAHHSYEHEAKDVKRIRPHPKQAEVSRG